MMMPSRLKYERACVRVNGICEVILTDLTMTSKVHSKQRCVGAARLKLGGVQRVHSIHW